jgi:excinuclease ABC subunit C
MIGKRSYTAAPQLDENITEILPAFIIEYQKQSDGEQEKIVIDPQYSEIIPELNAYFQELNQPLKLAKPYGVKEASLIKMANENAMLHLSQILSKVETSESLKLLQNILELDALPMRIEGFDIANILGRNAVASMVSFYAGKPDKKNYRHFKIKTKETPDDPAMIHEAVFRRYRRLKDENLELPDLILIDGGKTQLNAAQEALSEAGINLNVISLAKKNEEIYNLYSEDPIVLEKNSPALHILQQVRDESHRFANSFYNRLKGKDLLESAFEKIEGIGEKRKKIIMQKFLNYDIINQVKLDDLIKEGLPRKSAEEVLKIIRKNIPDQGGKK